MYCGYCFREVEETIQSDLTGVDVCEECYWLEVLTGEDDVPAGEGTGWPGPREFVARSVLPAVKQVQ